MYTYKIQIQIDVDMDIKRLQINCKKDCKRLKYERKMYNFRNPEDDFKR